VWVTVEQQDNYCQQPGVPSVKCVAAEDHVSSAEDHVSRLESEDSISCVWATVEQQDIYGQQLVYLVSNALLLRIM